jgi:hypothetical protein
MRARTRFQHCRASVRFARRPTAQPNAHRLLTSTTAIRCALRCPLAYANSVKSIENTSNGSGSRSVPRYASTRLSRPEASRRTSRTGEGVAFGRQRDRPSSLRGKPPEPFRPFCSKRTKMGAKCRPESHQWRYPPFQTRNGVSGRRRGRTNVSKAGPDGPSAVPCGQPCGPLREARGSRPETAQPEITSQDRISSVSRLGLKVRPSPTLPPRTML